MYEMLKFMEVRHGLSIISKEKARNLCYIVRKAKGKNKSDREKNRWEFTIKYKRKT